MRIDVVLWKAFRHLHTLIIHGPIGLVRFGSHASLTALHLNSYMKAGDLDFVIGVVEVGSQLRELSVRLHSDFSAGVASAMTAISRKFPRLHFFSIGVAPVNALVRFGACFNV